MQPSEIWRRGIVLPFSTDVAEQIACWDVDDSTPVDVLPIDDDLFNQLWDIRLFSDINDACGTLIDDYESEWLLPDQFAGAMAVVRRHQLQSANGRVEQFLHHLAGMIDRASGTGMPLYFEC